MLLCAWSNERVQKALAENLRNTHVFKHLSARMSEMGFCRSPHQCRLRVKTLKANYVRAKLQRSGNTSQPCTFKYFPEMDAVLGRRREGEPYSVSVDDMAGHCIQRAECIPMDSNLSKDADRLHRYSSERSFGSLEESEIDPEVKVESAEESAEESKLGLAGCSQLQRDQQRQQVHLQAGLQPQNSSKSSQKLQMMGW